VQITGELLIRHSLEKAFSELGVALDVITSDNDFLKANMNRYDIVIIDPWTWAAKGIGALSFTYIALTV
jgi:DNA-binding response OmpR family regulator